MHLLISWFNARIRRQSCETQHELEEVVRRLITDIDCSAFDATFIASIYSRRGSAFGESAVCK